MAAFDLPVNDVLLAHIFREDPTRMRSAMERAEATGVPVIPPRTAPEPDPEHLADFVSSVPPVVTRLLVETAPFLSRLRWALQVVSWKSGSYSESWLALAAFWAICLWLHFTVRYFFPVLICAPYIAAAVASRIRAASKSSLPPAATEYTTTETSLQTSLSDLSIIQHLLPTRPPLASFDLPTLSIIRLVLVGYLLYVTTVTLLPANVILALIGTLLMTWRAPWARTIRQILMSNGWVRFLSRRAWQLSTGTTPETAPIPPASISSSSSSDHKFSMSKSKPAPSASASVTMDIPDDVPPPSSLRFRFAVQENQRWWMGLDFTAALLPQERASWTSTPPALKPVPPPMAITLPPTTTVYLPLPGGQHKNFRMKRTATWSWAESAWGVVVRLNSSTPAERVVMALPKIDPTATGENGAPTGATTSQGPAEGLLQRGLQRIGTVDLGMGTPKSPTASRTASSSYGGGSGAMVRSASPEARRRRSLHASEDSAHSALFSDDEDEHGGGSVDVPVAKEEEETSVTDAEGWIYSDNKWEGAASKNGIGKFTRSRRWTRIALLTETVEIVPATENPNHTPTTSSSSLPPSSRRSALPSSPTRVMKSPPVAPALAIAANAATSAGGPVSPTPISPAGGTGKEKEKGSALRQRLQKVVEG